MESIHLLHVEDFKALGVGLADARLLVEKYRTKIRESELKRMAHAVRTGNDSIQGNKSKKKKDNQNINVEFMWHHWDSKLKRYKPVRLCNGGGLRRKLYSRLTALDIVLDDMVQVYFPGGRNTLCSLNLVTTNFAAADMAVIDKEMTVARYLEIKALRIPKFILQTRTQSIFNICHSSSSSSESDFEINRDFTRMRKNKSRIVIPHQEVTMICDDEITPRHQ